MPERESKQIVATPIWSLGLHKPDQQGSIGRLVVIVIAVAFVAALGGRLYVQRQIAGLQDRLNTAQTQLQTSLDESDSLTDEELENLANEIAEARVKLDEDIPAELQQQYQDLIQRLTVLADSTNAETAATAQDLLDQLTNTAGTGIAVSGPNKATISNTGVLSVNGGNGDVTVQGTANQLTVSGSGSTVLLSLPQDIATTSSPTFANVNVSGSLNVSTIGGDGSAVTNVDAVTLQGNAASYFTNASNLSSGTLADARLSSNVALKDQANVFTNGQTIQTGAAGTVGLTIQGAAGQTAALLNITDSDATSIFRILDLATSKRIYFGPGDAQIVVEGTNYKTLRLDTNGGTTASDNWIIGRFGSSVNKIYFGDSGSTTWIQSGHALAFRTGRGSSPNTTADPHLYISTAGTVQVASTGAAGTVEKFRVNTPTTVSNTAATILSTGAVTSVGLVVQGVASQTANLQEWQNSSGTVLARITSGGGFTSNGSVGAGTGFTSTLTGTGMDLYMNRTSDTNPARITAYWGGATSYGLRLESGISSVTQYANGYAVYVGNVFSSPVTSGNFDILRAALTFNPASGSSQMNGVSINPIINQTGTATGISRGLYVNPTLTSAVNFRGVEITNTSGHGIYQSGASTVNYLAGVTKIGSTGTAGTVEKFKVNTSSTVDNAANAVITASDADSKPLVIQGFSAQTANLQEWQNSSGTVLASVDSSGRISATGGNDVQPGFRFQGDTDTGFYQWNNQVMSTTGGNWSFLFGNNKRNYINTTTTGTSALTIVPGLTSDYGLVVRGRSGQTANLQEWQDSSGLVLASVSSLGQLSASSLKADKSLTIGGWLSGITGDAIVIKNTADTSVLRLSSEGGIRGGGSTYGARSVFGAPSAFGNYTLGVTSQAAYTPLVVRGASGQTANLQEWQDSSGTVLASISAGGNLEVIDATVNGNLVVDGTATFNGTLTVNGHIISGNTSGSTTIAAGVAAGVGASASISGNDTAGTVTLTTGTGATSGTLATITFASSYGSAPRVMLSASDADTAALQVYRTSTTTTFVINVASTPTDSTTYEIDYFVVQ